MEAINKKVNMSSHSGAGIEVIKEDAGIFVCKTINEGLVRAEKSVEKQKLFRDIDTVEYKIRAAPIDYLRDENQLTARMPYIEGISGAQISSNGNKALAKNIRLSLNNYFIDSIANSREVQVSRNIFENKIEDIASKILASDIQRNFDLAIKWLNENMPLTLNIPEGACHGDLTLSNVIITQSHELYLIDFLDSYLESPLQDAAKIYQDMVCGWSFRHETSALRLRSQLFCDSAFPDYLHILDRIYKKEMGVFKLMTILRIAPYISSADIQTINWFNRVIKIILKTF